MTQLEQAQKD
jgi:hypothetical protein